MKDETKQLYDCNACVFKSLSCLLLTEDEFEVIRNQSIQVKFSKGETVFKQGGKAGSLIFLHKGIVKYTYEYETGKTYIMTVTKGPKLLGGANLFFKATNIFSIVAVEECEICYIDFDTIKQASMKNPNYLMALCESALNMFQHSIFNFISLAHNQVNGRIANILLYLWDHVYKDSPYEFNLSRKELAEFAACSHENVISTLSKFKKEGLLQLEGKKITICNYSEMKKISKLG
ncbi:MAG: Crp/Fnr family transcriptional regulator [Prolixibacteraceae bacterium]|jgi:CRP-like cAMP-binding protein|nr:Crp/Fnr family transcriptional regulator [Prolixibacteraceae bacterium]